VQQRNPIILFDGICNFCNGNVNFIIRQDNKKIFRLAALQSEAGQRLLQQYKLPMGDFDSFVLVHENKVYNKSSAALKVYSLLPWYWKWTQLIWIFPRFIRDAVYDFIARHRYKWFGKKEQCMVPTAELRGRFLE
jgi:predicted DCC family thiol-disulfide oxidoreductase YuxK